MPTCEYCMFPTDETIVVPTYYSSCRYDDENDFPFHMICSNGCRFMCMRCNHRQTTPTTDIHGWFPNIKCDNCSEVFCPPTEWYGSSPQDACQSECGMSCVKHHYPDRFPLKEYEADRMQYRYHKRNYVNFSDGKHHRTPAHAEDADVCTIDALPPIKRSGKCDDCGKHGKLVYRHANKQEYTKVPHPILIHKSISHEYSKPLTAEMRSDVGIKRVCKSGFCQYTHHCGTEFMVDNRTGWLSPYYCETCNEWGRPSFKWYSGESIYSECRKLHIDYKGLKYEDLWTYTNEQLSGHWVYGEVVLPFETGNHN